jgi:hypothetical protein
MDASAVDRRHTYWSDPGAHRARLSELSDDPATIADRLEEFVIHHDIARQLRVGVPEAAETDRGLRRASLLLAEAIARDPSPLTKHRSIENYLYVTCRDFALLAVSTLREHQVPARLRVGFASYFNSGLWLDHWVCEHRAGTAWSLLDAQLGPRARAGLRIGFDIADVPESGWRSAASIWRSVRAGELDPSLCGLPSAGIAGEWWIAASVVRDAGALAGIEGLPWDAWGLASSFHSTREVTREQADQVDLLAAAIDPPPANRSAADAVLARFPWACPAPQDRAALEGRSAAYRSG